MKKIGLVLVVFMAATRGVAGQDEGMILDGQSVELYNKALSCSGEGDYRGAVNNLLKAIERTPDARQFYIALVEPCFNTNQLAVLKEQLRKAKTLFPKDDELCYYLATVYQRENNQAMAIREFSLAIDNERKKGKKPGTFSMLSTYYMYRGNCHMKINQFDKAIEDYDRSLALDESTGSIYANRGFAHFKTGKPFLACKDWQKAKSLGISSVNQYITRYCK